MSLRMRQWSRFPREHNAETLNWYILPDASKIYRGAERAHYVLSGYGYIPADAWIPALLVRPI